MGSEKTEFFGRENAAKYDNKWAEGAPIKDALHLLTKIAFMDLPANSDILCVGVGTGAELIALAQSNPGWKFTALDSSGAMLDVCREKLDKAGLLSRCDFHHGYIDSLPQSRTYHAATSILVSQFITSKTDRTAFFKEINSHLQPKGYLLNADLVRPMDEQGYRELLTAWGKMHRYNGLTQAQAEASTALWNTHVAISTAEEIETLLISGGFVNPLLIFQALFIHAWVARNSRQ